VRVFLLFLILVACSKQEQAEMSDDYVLVEFASKLEEDYQKLSGHEGLPPQREDRPKK
jgi:hypothetical protein